MCRYLDGEGFSRLFTDVVFFLLIRPGIHPDAQEFQLSIPHKQNVPSGQLCLTQRRPCLETADRGIHNRQVPAKSHRECIKDEQMREFKVLKYAESASSARSRC